MAFYFAREIHQKLGVPVGLIIAPWSGSPIEPFIAPAAYGMNPDLKNETAALELANGKFAQGYGQALDKVEAFLPKAKIALAEGKPLPPITQSTTTRWIAAARPVRIGE